MKITAKHVGKEKVDDSFDQMREDGCEEAAECELWTTELCREKIGFQLR